MSEKPVALPIKSQTDSEWVRQRIKEYSRKQRGYALYADVLKKVLEYAIQNHAPLAIIQARPKSLASYAEKIQRKTAKYREVDAAGKSLYPITDLCAARVITLTLPEVECVCRFIEDHFEVDRANSVDVATHLRTNEFGYLSTHYVVRFRHGVFPTKDIPVKIPTSSYGLDAEIQVRTLLEYAWAAVSHDICYKSSFSVPAKWQRELACLAAIFEDADESFLRVQSGLGAYKANCGAYMTPDQIRDERRKLETVLRAERRNADVAHRIAKLSMCLEEWEAAVRVLIRLRSATSRPC
jgi:ppGpp synthetase/RelA/SpoT-type nucleotidyltranferase